MSKVIMSIGIPGSGKTTALKPFAEQYGYTYISTDEIRARIADSAIDQSNNSEVWKEAYKEVIGAIQKGKTVVFDATFYKDFERKQFIKFVKEHGAEKVQGIFSDVPFEVASERNKSRERVVPEHAMNRMSSLLKDIPPEIKDGFDSLFTINELQELEKAEVMRQNEVLTKEFKTSLY